MGILSDINRKRKKATKKILNPFVKAAGKISDKLIPNELRWAMPYAAGIGTLMLPPGMSLLLDQNPKLQVHQLVLPIMH